VFPPLLEHRWVLVLCFFCGGGGWRFVRRGHGGGEARSGLYQSTLIAWDRDLLLAGCFFLGLFARVEILKTDSGYLKNAEATVGARPVEGLFSLRASRAPVRKIWRFYLSSGSFFHFMRVNPWLSHSQDPSVDFFSLFRNFSSNSISFISNSDWAPDP